MAYSRRQLDQAQSWLITRMQKLGYRDNPKGICHGVACMGMQAILANDLKSFDERLTQINDISLEEFSFSKIEQEKGKDFRVSVNAFFDGVELYLNDYLYEHLFEVKNPDMQDIKKVAPLITPVKIEKPEKDEKVKTSEEPDGIYIADKFSGAYTQDELADYFNSFSDALKQASPSLKEPVALVLNSSNHSICVGYDPTKDQWYIIDANHLPSSRIPSNPDAFASMVAFRLNAANQGAEFTTRICCNNKDEKALKSCMASLRADDNWEKIHAITSEKAQFIDSFGANLLYLEAESGTAEAMQVLLEKGANPNQATTDGMTPLLTAVMRDKVDAVQKLLEWGANPNQAHIIDGTPPLFVAVKYGYIDVVKALLEKGAKINELGITISTTPLFLATQAGNLEMVQFLFEKGADPKQVDNDGLTALFLAAQEGQSALVELLIEHHADISAAFNSTVDSLRDFAEQYDVAAAMEILLQEKTHPSSANISITPEEIAAVMGHKDIAERLKSLREQQKDLTSPQQKTHEQVEQQSAVQQPQDAAATILRENVYGKYTNPKPITSADVQQTDVKSRTDEESSLPPPSHSPRR